jgi:hypothetical protein
MAKHSGACHLAGVGLSRAFDHDGYSLRSLHRASSKSNRNKQKNAFHTSTFHWWELKTLFANLFVAFINPTL